MSQTSQTALPSLVQSLLSAVYRKMPQKLHSRVQTSFPQLLFPPSPLLFSTYISSLSPKVGPFQVNLTLGLRHVLSVLLWPYELDRAAVRGSQQLHDQLHDKPSVSFPLHSLPLIAFQLPSSLYLLHSHNPP